MAGLSGTVDELTADREHGASWMARRTVETMLEVAERPFQTSTELFDALVDAGRKLSESRPGVGECAPVPRAGPAPAARLGGRASDPPGPRTGRRLDRDPAPGSPQGRSG